jgi:hypothetical protein
MWDSSSPLSYQPLVRTHNAIAPRKRSFKDAMFAQLLIGKVDPVFVAQVAQRPNYDIQCNHHAPQYRRGL